MCRGSRSCRRSRVGPHVGRRRSGLRPRHLPAFRLPHLRQPRRPHRHPGAPRRSDPPGARLDAGAPGERPAGAFAEGRAFTVTPAMSSLLGASGEDIAVILKGLGYRVERRPKPPEPVVAEPATAAERTPTESPPPNPEAPAARAAAGRRAAGRGADDRAAGRRAPPRSLRSRNPVGRRGGAAGRRAAGPGAVRRSRPVGPAEVGRSASRSSCESR